MGEGRKDAFRVDLRPITAVSCLRNQYVVRHSRPPRSLPSNTPERLTRPRAIVRKKQRCAASRIYNRTGLR